VSTPGGSTGRVALGEPPHGEEERAAAGRHAESPYPVGSIIMRPGGHGRWKNLSALSTFPFVPSSQTHRKAAHAATLHTQRCTPAASTMISVAVGTCSREKKGVKLSQLCGHLVRKSNIQPLTRVRKYSIRPSWSLGGPCSRRSLSFSLDNNTGMPQIRPLWIKLT
jgi:hypothetical protein